MFTPCVKDDNLTKLGEIFTLVLYISGQSAVRPALRCY